MMEQGDLENARTTYQEALKIEEAKLGAESPSTLATKTNLANVLVEQGDLKGCCKLEEAVMRAKEQQLGPEHPSTKMSKGNHGFTLEDMAKEAEKRV